MQKPSNYDQALPYTDSMKLPVGGYVCRILQAKEIGPTAFSSGYLEVIFDIAEGEQAGFYRRNYDAQQANKRWKGTYRLWSPDNSGSEQDNRANRSMKTFFNAVEGSNPGYVWNWNEASLVDKSFGAVFGEREFLTQDEKIATVVEIQRVKTADEIRSGNYTIPEIRRLKQDAPIEGTSFTPVPDDIDENLPFA